MNFYNLYKNGPVLPFYHDVNENVVQYPEDPFTVLSANDLLRLRTNRTIFDDDSFAISRDDVDASTLVDLQPEDLPTTYQDQYTELQEKVQKEIEEAKKKEEEEKAKQS